MNTICICKTHKENKIFHLVGNIDPTRTFLLRKKFEIEIVRRFRRLIKIIKIAVVDDDVFGLKAKVNQRFAFKKDADKLQAFMGWLDNVEQKEILETFRIFGVKKYTDENWMSIYIRSAYQRGIARARIEMDKAGIDYIKGAIELSFNRPIHANAISLLYTRAFHELKGITQAIDKEISRVLAEGFVKGDNPLTIARNLSNRVEKIGITRARTLARTEIIRAHHEANINEYEQANIEGVQVLAELLTAGDSRVCNICFQWEKKTKKNPLSISDAKGLIPIHPNCRCVIVPFTKKFREFKKRYKN